MEFLPLRIDDQRVYAGFWKRLAAALIDAAITLPVFYLMLSSRKLGYNLAIIDTILCGGMFVAYDVYFNRQYGGSPGKLAMGIRVTKPDGSRIGWAEAWKRSSVDVLLALVFVYIYLLPLLQIGSSQFLALGITERQNFLLPHDHPPWYRTVDILKQIWYWSELVVLLLNRRKRALHDFIAGTVVVNNKLAKRAAMATLPRFCRNS